jgi:hypothetical protein
MVQVQEQLLLDIRPGPSSQTTACWMVSTEMGPTRVVADSYSHDAGNFIVEPPRLEVWDDIVENVLRDRAELWKRLADR